VHEKPESTASTTSLTREAISPSFEVLLKATTLESGKKNPFQVFVSDYATNQPVDKARVELEFDNHPKIVTQSVAPGIYQGFIRFEKPGDYSAIISILKGNQSDLLTLDSIPVQPPSNTQLSLSDNRLWLVCGLVLLGITGVIIWQLKHRKNGLLLLVLTACTVQAHEGHQEEIPGTSAVPGTLLAVAKETQFTLGIRTVLSQEHAVIKQIETTGQIIPDPKGMGEVYASHQGKVISTHLPVIGQWVVRGQTLALVEEVFHSLEGLQVKTDLVKVEAELAQIRLELNLSKQEIRLAKEEEKLTRQNLERLKQIKAVIAQKEIPLAELALLRAQVQLAKTQGNLDKTRIRWQELGKERAYFKDLVKKGNTTRHLFPIVAPLSGVITHSALLIGKQVHTQEKLIEIVNPTTVWLEAHLFEPDLALFDEVKEAVIQVEAYPVLKWLGRLVTVGQKVV
jgi:multidrug efflux pump subunit AcrA (membrane-fusion protein)